MAVLHSGTSDDGDPILSWLGCSGSGPFGITSALLTSFSGEHDYVESTPSPNKTMFSITGDSKEVDCGELFRRNPRGFDCDLRRRKFVSGGSSRLLRYTSVQRGGISRLTYGRAPGQNFLDANNSWPIWQSSFRPNQCREKGEHNLPLTDSRHVHHQFSLQRFSRVVHLSLSFGCGSMFKFEVFVVSRKYFSLWFPGLRLAGPFAFRVLVLAPVLANSLKKL